MIWKHERLLRGSEIKVGATKVQLPTLGEVFDMGLDLYLERLQTLILDTSEIRESLIKDGFELSHFEVLLLIISQEKTFQDSFFEALRMFTDQTFVLNEGYIVAGSALPGLDPNDTSLSITQIFDEKYWLELRSVLRLAHWQDPVEEIEYGSNKAKAMMEKIKRNQERVRKIKEKRGEGSSELYELISAVSIYSSSYNLINIWDLTYYQFFDQFYRLNLSDNYSYSMRSLLAGADPKKTKVEHWTSPIHKHTK